MHAPVHQPYSILRLQDTLSASTSSRVGSAPGSKQTARAECRPVKTRQADTAPVTPSADCLRAQALAPKKEDPWPTHTIMS